MPLHGTVIEVAAGILLHYPKDQTGAHCGFPLLCLARRSGNRSHAGWWELPGGKLENQETAAQALVREIREELELSISILGPLELPALIPSADPRIRLHFLVAQAMETTAVSLAHDLVSWVSASTLATMLDAEPDFPILPADRPILEFLCATGFPHPDLFHVKH